MVIFLSKYFSRAKENKNSEKTDIKIEGINVNKEKKVMYFLFALDPSITISFLIEFFISKKIIEKNTSNFYSEIEDICSYKFKNEEKQDIENLLKEFLSNNLK